MPALIDRTSEEKLLQMPSACMSEEELGGPVRVTISADAIAAKLKEAEELEAHDRVAAREAHEWLSAANLILHSAKPDPIEAGLLRMLADFANLQSRDVAREEADAAIQRFLSSLGYGKIAIAWIEARDLRPD